MKIVRLTVFDRPAAAFGIMDFPIIAVCDRTVGFEQVFLLLSLGFFRLHGDYRRRFFASYI